MRTYQDFPFGTAGFIKALQANVDAAHADVMGACAVSTDPKVRGAWERWRAFQEITEHHVTAGKQKAEQR